MSSLTDKSKRIPAKEIRKEHRTRDKAGNVAVIPKNSYAIITQKDYQNSLGLFRQGNAFLQPIKKECELECSDGRLYIRGLPASLATLKSFYADKIPNLDLPFLRFFYNIILNNCQDNLNKGIALQESYTIYLPDFIKSVGRISCKDAELDKRDDVTAIIDRIMSFHHIIGIVDGDCLPILLFTGENQSKNTISFMSPYMNRIIENVFTASICEDKKSKKQIRKKRPSERKAVYSYLIKPEILKERNRKAVEIVHIIVALVEQAGNNLPHISAKTIVERNVLLQESILSSSKSDRNKVIKRAFSKAWELLRTQTKLQVAYPGILLPDSNDVPTMKTLDKKIYTFGHSGKLKSQSDIILARE